MLSLLLAFKNNPMLFLKLCLRVDLQDHQFPPVPGEKDTL